MRSDTLTTEGRAAGIWQELSTIWMTVNRPEKAKALDGRSWHTASSTHFRPAWQFFRRPVIETLQSNPGA
jgi:hypothetical protein